MVSHCRHVVDFVGTDFQSSDGTARIESFQKQEKYGDGSDFKFQQGSITTTRSGQNFREIRLLHVNMTWVSRSISPEGLEQMALDGEEDQRMKRVKVH